MNVKRTLAMVAAIAVAALLVPFTGPVHADHFFEEPCGYGQEILIGGITWVDWDVTIEIEDSSGTYFGRQRYFMHEWTDDWKLGLAMKVMNIGSWERVKGLGIYAEGPHVILIDCVDEDPDIYGPVLHL